MEGYLIDDSGVIVSSPDDGSVDRDYVVLDIETTGLYAGKDRIIEIAAVKIGADDKILDEFHTMVNPGMRIPPATIQVHGITDDMVADAPRIAEVMPQLADFCADTWSARTTPPLTSAFCASTQSGRGWSCPRPSWTRCRSRARS